MKQASGEMRCTHCKDTAEDHVHVWRGTGWVLFCDWTKTNTFTPAAVPESAIEPEPQRGKCECGHEEEDHREGVFECLGGWIIDDKEINCGCEDYEPPAASSTIEVAPQDTSDVCPKCNGGGIKDDQGYTTVCWYCSGKGRVNFRPSVAPQEAQREPEQCRSFAGLGDWRVAQRSVPSEVAPSARPNPRHGGSPRILHLAQVPEPCPAEALMIIPRYSLGLDGRMWPQKDGEFVYHALHEKALRERLDTPSREQRLEQVLRWMSNNRALTIFIEEPEHVADFFKRCDVALEAK